MNFGFCGDSLFTSQSQISLNGCFYWLFFFIVFRIWVWQLNSKCLVLFSLALFKKSIFDQLFVYQLVWMICFLHSDGISLLPAAVIRGETGASKQRRPCQIHFSELSLNLLWIWSLQTKRKRNTTFRYFLAIVHFLLTLITLKIWFVFLLNNYINFVNN